MRTRRVIIAAVAAVVIGLAIYYFILPERDGYCRRCGSDLHMRGPFVVGLFCFHSGELDEGDPVTYCRKHGHLFTSDKSQRCTINDWQHQRDAYNTDAEYNANNPSTQ